MRLRLLRLFFIAAVAAFFTATLLDGSAGADAELPLAVAGSATPSDPRADHTSLVIEADLLRLVREARSAVPHTLSCSATLAAQAELHSREMATNGSTFVDLDQHVDVDRHPASALIVATGSSHPHAILNEWWRSQRATLESEAYDTVGIGHFRADDTDWWTAIFATAVTEHRPCATPSG